MPILLVSNIFDSLSSKISDKIETFLNFSGILSDKEGMEGMTVSEIAAELKISVDAVRKRIETAGIQPITREAIYDPAIVDQIRSVRMGRPPKPKGSKPEGK